jgi:murein DD-endopeptidase MepM/ murein hydrolase activator NlpD
VLALLVVVAVAPSTARAEHCAPNDTACRQLQDAKQNQADAGRRLQDIQNSIADVQHKANETAAYVQQLSGQIEQQKAVVAQTQARLAEIDRQIRFTEAEIGRREAHMRVREQLLAQRVRTLDKHGAFQYLEMVVTARSFTDLVDRVMITHDVIRSDRMLLDTLRQERGQIQQLWQKLEVEHGQQADLLKQQQQQQAQLEAIRKAQQDALTYFQQLEAQFEDQRRQLEAEKAKIDGMVSILQARYDAQARTLGGGTGRFAWPEQGPITQPFGCTDLLGEPYDPSCPTRHFHTGIDIGDDFGTPIAAADSGVVSLVNFGWGGGYGNYVLVTHGNGYATLYAHLSAISVSEGQAVKRGQVLGAEGSTGFSTGPHLHFEIRLNGAYQNPLSYLA